MLRAAAMASSSLPCVTTRAVAFMHHFAKDIKFCSYDADHDMDMICKPAVHDVTQVFREFLAMVWYLVRHDISPGTQ
jgi:hypothetical protein